MVRYLTQNLTLWADAPPPAGQEKGELYAGFPVQLKEAEPQSGEPMDGNDQYYETVGGDFLWAGGLVEENPTISVETALPSSSDLWYHKALRLDDLWADRIYGQGIHVGIIDTGIDPSHPGFSPNQVASWKDFSFAKDPKSSDQDGHGTLVAGILAANQGNLLGVAPKCHLHIARVKEFPASAVKNSFVADAIRWLVEEKGCTLINCSLGLGAQDIEEISSVIAQFREKTLLVAPVGNKANKNAAQFPAIHADTLAVGATDVTGSPSPLITVDLTKADAWAPGENIGFGFIPKWKSSDYYVGTSFATALVTGLAALLQQKTPTLKGPALKQTLIDYLKPLFTTNPT